MGETPAGYLPAAGTSAGGEPVLPSPAETAPGAAPTGGSDTGAGAGAGRVPPRSLVAGRAGRLLVGTLLLVKLGVTGFNAATFDGWVYDQPHHAWRARSGGLEVGRMAYNPPLYYLPALIRTAAWEAGNPGTLPPDRVLLRFLRYTNVAWLSLFYCCWLFGIFPRLLPARAAVVASVLLLALPGFQRLAAMVHPDLALAALSSAAFWAYLLLRERGFTVRGGLLLGLLIGLTGMTRPFAAVPVLVFWAAGALVAIRSAPGLGKGLARVALLTAVAAPLAAGWYGYRLAATGTLTDSYPKGYLERYEPWRPGFRFAPYFLSFHLKPLLKVPNRRINRLDRRAEPGRNRYADSFFTTLHSDTWGDHWLYFSGKPGKETKRKEKRVVLLAALPVAPLLILGLPWVVRGLRRRARDGLGSIEPQLVALATLLLGIAFYLWWQTGTALLPGKQGTIKFTYLAYLFPFGLAALLDLELGPKLQAVWLAYGLLVFAAALPMALFAWP